MAPFYASIWALIEEKGIKCVITTRKKAREFFLKNIVAVDGLNQGHNGGRAPVTFAEQRTNLDRRLIKICLLGGRPVVFLDGRHASPGAGKTKQHAARAAVSPPLRHDLPARHPTAGSWRNRAERQGRLPLGFGPVRRRPSPADRFRSRQKNLEEVRRDSRPV